MPIRSMTKQVNHGLQIFRRESEQQVSLSPNDDPRETGPRTGNQAGRCSGLGSFSRKREANNEGKKIGIGLWKDSFISLVCSQYLSDGD